MPPLETAGCPPAGGPPLPQRNIRAGGESPSSKAAAYPVELHVEATSVADGLALRVPAPQGGGRGVAVGTGQAQPPGRGLEARVGKHRCKQAGRRK